MTMVNKRNKIYCISISSVDLHILWENKQMKLSYKLMTMFSKEDLVDLHGSGGYLYGFCKRHGNSKQ